jgi:hypothetical protein
MTPIETGESILRYIDHISEAYSANYDRIGELDRQLCDLNHIIEFTPMDIQKGYKFAKQLQDLRKERRALKDENELLKPIHKFLSTGQSTAFRNGLANAIGKAKQRERTLPLRVYTPRSQAFQEGGEVKACESQ